MARLILVSNRLPVKVEVRGENVDVAPSEGGLATGLWGPHQDLGGLWIGWPGTPGRVATRQRKVVADRLAELSLVPVELSAADLAGFYEGFSNGVLWPLFHYLLDRIPQDARDWDVYRAVNERYAEVVAAHYRPGDMIWVHDYQLMLLPALLRRRLEGARIGFFLHIPFPAAEVFRTLPWRREILEGLLGADLIGFHTYSYARAFASSLLMILGCDVEVDELHVAGREVRLGVFPIGVDAALFAAHGDDPAIQAEAARIRENARGERILLGVDRLDYTKGIPRRLLAVERLLEREPSWRGQVRFLQVAVPSREKVESYRTYRRQVDELVGRINGTFGTIGSAPIHYLYRGFTQPEVASFYRAADVMVVTPLRDGMNLVAKEFVATRTDDDGVLVLSELAGAASELGEALHVNPYDLDGVAAALHRALTMDREERARRMRALRERVGAFDVHVWARSFLAALETTEAAGARVAFSADEALVEAREQARGAEHLALVLDYDGTLVEFAASPKLARPDEELLALVSALAARPRTEVHIVSGRPRDALEAFFGELPVGLSAEHGLYFRRGPGASWDLLREVRDEWKEKVFPILERFVGRTPGTFIEEKTCSLAWHYRLAAPDHGAEQARRLRLHLANLVSQLPVEVLLGDRVVEVRMRDVHKGLVIDLLRGRLPAGAQILAMGDDRTDEDLFAALPHGALSIHVGPHPSRAQLRVRNVAAARAFLRQLLEASG